MTWNQVPMTVATLLVPAFNVVMTSTHVYRHCCCLIMSMMSSVHILVPFLGQKCKPQMREWRRGHSLRLGMMVSFLVKADQDGMGFWAPPLFGEASMGLRAWREGQDTGASQLSCYSSSNERMETGVLIRPGMTGSSMYCGSWPGWNGVRLRPHSGRCV
jgi:hypothetical protein